MSLVTKNAYLIAFVGGGSGSIIAQSISVPIDVLSQHMMLIGQHNGAHKSSSAASNLISNKPNLKPIERIIVPDRLERASTFQIVKYLSKEIYKTENVKGFYRGYFLSTFLVSFNSSLWWPFYYFYQGKCQSIKENDYEKC